MNHTKSKILQSAIEVFSRYGVKRTTMGDIAQSAEVSRQTLYAAFKNKDEILAFASEAFGAEIVENLNEHWVGAKDVSEVLDVYFEFAVLHPFDKMQSLPESQDLVNGVGKATDVIIKRLEAQKAELLAQQFSPYEAVLRESGSDARALGNFVERASRGFKHSTTDREQLETLLDTLKSAVLAMVKR